MEKVFWRIEMSDTSSRPLRRGVSSAYCYGVCAGLAYCWMLPSVLIHILCALLITITFPLVFFIYIGLWLTLPKWDIEPDDFNGDH